MWLLLVVSIMAAGRIDTIHDDGAAEKDSITKVLSLGFALHSARDYNVMVSSDLVVLSSVRTEGTEKGNCVALNGGKGRKHF